MALLIPDNAWRFFRRCPTGSREGRIVLVHPGKNAAGQNGGLFTVKKYQSEKTVTADGWRHDRIQLLPVNLAFEPIEIEPEGSADVVIVGELLAATEMTGSSEARTRKLGAKTRSDILPPSRV